MSSHVVIQFGFDFAKVESSEDVNGHESDMKVIGLGFRVAWNLTKVQFRCE